MFKSFKVSDEVALTRDTIVGNFNPFPHDRFDDAVELLTKYCSGWWVIVGEGVNVGEHIHFVLSRLSVEIETLKKEIRTTFPFLKREKTGKKGGANKVKICLIKKQIQFYYLFKDIKCIESNITLTEDMKKDYNVIYEELKKGNVGGSYDKCLEFVNSKMECYDVTSPKKVRKIMNLILQFLEIENKSLRTYIIVERYFCFILCRNNRKKLAKMYADTFCLRNNL